MVTTKRRQHFGGKRFSKVSGFIKKSQGEHELNACATHCLVHKHSTKNLQQFRIFKLLFNNCQPKTLGFRVSTINLGHRHG